MQKYTALKALMPSTVTVYLTDLISDIKSFPAVIFNPANQIPEVELSNFLNRLLHYEWDCVIIVRKKDYSTFEACVDKAWELYESIPDLLKCKMLPADPFGHFIKNDEVYAIKLVLKSKLL
jgi:hypothetical protein